MIVEKMLPDILFGLVQKSGSLWNKSIHFLSYILP